MSHFKVLQEGILSIIQDEGRFGFNHLGITNSGPMDRESFYWANKLCGNNLGDPAIEITVGGLELLSNVSTSIAITGAQIPTQVNDQIIEMWKTIKISEGDIIKFGYMKNGMRSYLATAGGFDVKKTFTSTATSLRESLGGVHQDGKPLQRSDLIPCKCENIITPYECAEIPHRIINHSQDSSSVMRVVLGYQAIDFSDLQQNIFFNSEYTISDRNDRMGIRMLGPEIKSKRANMLSEGICLGAIQIPQDGQPIVLMNDRQTIGGYPKIGSIISDDLDKLSQLNQGDKIKFQQISTEKAHNLLSLRKFRINQHRPVINSKVLAHEIQNLLTSKNIRGMRKVSKFVPKGSYLRAAELLKNNNKVVFVGTGFPVNESFETDGPLGAIALYNCIKELGGEAFIVCDEPLFTAINDKFNTIKIEHGKDSSEALLRKYNPSLLISIERPGKNQDSRYYNMRGIDITEKCADFDVFFENASCPKISIGDGGNEIGMGNVELNLSSLKIKPSTTECDELLVADVSNWGAHGLIAMLSTLQNKDYLAAWENDKTLHMLSELGAVDGVSGKRTKTEDGFTSKETKIVINNLRKLSGFR